MPTLEDYTDDFGKAILEGFKKRGWNVYWLHVGDACQVIKRGPVDSLKPDFSYCTLPAVDDPTNPEQVREALDNFGENMNPHPYIEIIHGKHPIIGFVLRDKCVELRPEEGVYISYRDFIDSIGTIQKAV